MKKNKFKTQSDFKDVKHKITYEQYLKSLITPIKIKFYENRDIFTAWNFVKSIIFAIISLKTLQTMYFLSQKIETVDRETAEKELSSFSHTLGRQQDFDRIYIEQKSLLENDKLEKNYSNS